MLQDRLAVPTRPDGVLAGTLILVCGLLPIVAVAHHPVVRSHAPAQLLERIAAVGAIDEIVHGALILFMLALSYGFTVFAIRQGRDRQSSVGGLMCYLVGAVAVSMAALTDGFFMPAFAASNSAASGGALTAALAVLQGAATMIQVFTKFGFIALSLGILIWSIGLFGVKRVGAIAAGAGLIAAIVPLALLFYGTHLLTPRTVMLAMLSQAVWYVVIGTMLVRRIL